MEEFNFSQEWFQQNWNIALPFLVFIAVAILSFAIMFLTFQWIKSQEVYRQGIQIVRANSRVMSFLGEPLEESFFVTGSFSFSTKGGTANFSVKLIGSNDNARASFFALKKDGRWEFERVFVKIASNSEIISLIGKKNQY